ncbi:hypothetical protein D1872_202260 [compost metagenome]
MMSSVFIVKTVDAIKKLHELDGILAGSGYHIRITGLTTPDGYGASGAGNVYVN